MPAAMDAGDDCENYMRCSRRPRAARARRASKSSRCTRRTAISRIEFLSPMANQRTDRYGGSFENRTRFLLEVVAAVRSEWPDDKPLFVRISATDWVEGGWDLESSVQLAQALKAGGKVDLIDCSSGGLCRSRNSLSIPATRCRSRRRSAAARGIATGAVGMIYGPDMAEQIVANGQADMVPRRAHAERSVLAAACGESVEGEDTVAAAVPDGGYFLRMGMKDEG